VEALRQAPRAEAWSGAAEALAIEDTEIYRAATSVLEALAPLAELSEVFETNPLVALRVVTATRDVQRVGQVAELLRHPSVAVRISAAETLGLLHAVDALKPALRDPSGKVRAAAFRSTATAGDSASLHTLRELAQHETDLVARTALVDILDPHGLWP